MLNARLSSERTDMKYSVLANGKMSYSTTYAQVVNFFSRKYAIAEIITETKIDITHFTQTSNNKPSEELAIKTLQSGDVYKEYVLSKIFTKRLNVFIRHNMREYRGIRMMPACMSSQYTQRLYFGYRDMI